MWGEQMLLVFPVYFVTSFHEGQITGLICLSLEVPHVVANMGIHISLPHLLTRIEHVLNHEKQCWSELQEISFILQLQDS